MASRSNRLKFQTITNGVMTGDITSRISNIEFCDNIGFQFHFTGTPVGTFQIQVSANYEQDSLGNVTNVGNWIDLVLSGTPVAAGAPDEIYVDVTQISAPWIRAHYTFTSGTGTLQAWVVGKQI